MKKIILYYLYGFLLIDTILRFAYGSIEGGFHPGLIIRFGISILLINYFVKENVLPKKMNIFGVSAMLFTAVCIIQIVMFNIFSSHHVCGGYDSIKFSYKIVFMLLLANYVVTNADFFKPHTDRILYANIIVFLVNCIGGYLFGVGFLSYQSLSDSYRGYLAGNNSSIMSFVSFGFLLYRFQRRPKINAILLVSTMFTFYILGTKGFFVAVFILLLFIINEIRQFKIKRIIASFAILLTIFGVLSFYNVTENIQNRIMKNYYSQLSQSYMSLLDFSSTPLGTISPVRSDIAKRMLSLQFSDSAFPILCGYGVRGIYDVFGRPAMMDIPMIISCYGLFGFFAIYLGIFSVIARIIIHFDLDCISALIVAIFLYSSFGGFLMGTASMSALFAFLIGSKYSEFLTDKKYKKPKTSYVSHENINSL